MYYLSAAVVLLGIFDLIIYDKIVFSKKHGRAKRLTKGSKLNTALSCVGLIFALVLAIVVIDINTSGVKPAFLEANNIMSRELLILVSAICVYIICTFVIAGRMYGKRIEHKNLKLEKRLSGGWFVSMFCMAVSVIALGGAVIVIAI